MTGPSSRSCKALFRDFARVREVLDVTMQPHIEREMRVIDVCRNACCDAQVLSLVEVFRAKVVIFSQTGNIIEASETRRRLRRYRTAAAHGR